MPEVRDAVYGDIELTDTEQKILDTSAFQRLRRLYQLPTVHFVFPSATHTRFSQAIGTCEVADKIIKNIAETLDKSGDDIKRYKTYTRYAALLSDIEDPPYYTVFYEDKENEHFIISRLTELKKKLLKDICDEVNDSAKDKIDYDYLLRIYTADKPDSEGCYFIKQVIDSEVGADRLDYLERDSRFCGVPFGYVDSRILREFIVENNELLLKKTAIPIVNNIMHSLFQMKYSVYDHKISRGVTRMLKEAYRSYLKWKGRERGLSQLLPLEKPLDDATLLSILKETDVRNEQKHVENVTDRKLIKKVYSLEASTVRDINLISYFSEFQHYDELEKELSSNLGQELYLDSVQLKTVPATPIRVKVNGDSYPLDKSPMLRDWYHSDLLKQWKLFVFCYIKPETKRKDIESDVTKIFEYFQFDAKDREPSVRLSTLQPMYAYVDQQRRSKEKANLKPKIIELPDHQRKTLVEIARMKSATADEISEVTKRSRSLESLYLNQLVDRGLAEKRRIQGKGMAFFLAPHVAESLNELGYV